jgi:DNA-binding beta-propeller fold protein YncE
LKRPLVFTVLLFAAACGPTTTSKPPPSDRFYYPTGLSFVRPAGSTDGFLYVASSNFDRRYDFGSVLAVDLAQIGLPALGAPGADLEPVQLTQLPIGDTGVAYIQSFAGEMEGFPLLNGGTRLFVPSRAEGQLIQAIDAQGPALACPNAQGERNCADTSLSLVANLESESGVPRAPQPFGVGISPQGDVYVTHLEAVDSPPTSDRDFRAYLVGLSAQDPQLTNESFVPMPTLASSIAVGSRYLFLSGRNSSRLGFHLVTLLDRNTDQQVQPLLEFDFRVADARGIALSSDEQRLYVAGRGPDTLLVIEVKGATTEAPLLRIVRAIPLRAQPNEVKLVPRPGQGDLVAVTCSTDGSLVLYDAEVGDLVAQLQVGAQPFSIAVDSKGPGARLYVSNFADGRVAVVDIPDLTQPRQARVVAHLGERQTCLTQPKDASCQGVVP